MAPEATGSNPVVRPIINQEDFLLKSVVPLLDQALRVQPRLATAVAAAVVVALETTSPATGSPMVH